MFTARYRNVRKPFWCIIREKKLCTGLQLTQNSHTAKITPAMFPTLMTLTVIGMMKINSKNSDKSTPIILSKLSIVFMSASFCNNIT